MRQFFFLFFLLFLPCLSMAQSQTDLQLAQHYYSSGEFEKALPYYQKIYAKDNNRTNFSRYYDCLIKIGDKKEAEKLLKKQISKEPENIEYAMLLGNFYEQENRSKEAAKIYQELVNNYAGSSLRVVELYKLFKGEQKYEWAQQTLEKGRKTLKENFPLQLEFADLYSIQGKYDKMVDEYFSYLDLFPVNLEEIQTALTQTIDFSKEEDPVYDLVKQKLIEKTQKSPNTSTYPELLIWLFAQKRQFNAALIQVQALDKREKGMGKRVFNLGVMCAQNKAYDVARKAFKYVMDLGEDNTFLYADAVYANLNTSYLEITENKNYSQEIISSTISEYEKAIARSTPKTAFRLTMELATIKAYYARQSENAQKLLEELITKPFLTSIQSAEAKVLLADILVLRNEIWDASIYYMQVEKDFKYEVIGSEAKFKNARIFYYDGDFRFAQSQLDVLKQSTSKLIANDAMQLSLLITDNYGLDSNYTAMRQFAAADLLFEQHQYDQAFKIYDSIVANFPTHGLADEILFRKAKAMQNLGKWKEAVAYYEAILANYNEDILADDAAFQLGDLYENHLFDKEKAMEYYKKILFEYKGSLYTAEARKRVRILRGDKLTEEELN